MTTTMPRLRLRAFSSWSAARRGLAALRLAAPRLLASCLAAPRFAAPRLLASCLAAPRFAAPRLAALLLVVAAAWGLAGGDALRLAAPASAADSQEALAPADEGEVRAFLEELALVSIETLADSSRSRAEREQDFRALLEENFDVDAIVGFVLGRHWRRTDEAQRASLREVFVRATARRFVPLFEDYSGDGVTISAVEKDEQYPQIAGAGMAIPYNGQVADTMWRVYRSAPDAYSVLDISVEGVSMSISLREEYGSVIRNVGVDGLIAQLNEKFPETAR